ncbi:TPA: hypothetical protein N0F65_009030 [Lagenidium giganteum]|uniref:Fungal lipase-like domain-containing protein n=1 Tax=Lagenidium giganteum TaxID=4803 RepID=A0AAV2YUQ7_9STRA|nr:TPA: hypothetical protein N0F65_009030 [Lagenidium giganteum]
MIVDTPETHEHDSGSAREQVRLLVEGWQERRNDVLVSYVHHAKCTVVYFPGDVQDFTENMSEDSYSDFGSFAYECVVELLLERFGSESNVVIVRPSRFHHGVFSCFDNFTQCNKLGATTAYHGDGDACRHLLCLLQGVEDRLSLPNVLERPIHVVGFSKGGVVLSQLVTELAALSFGRHPRDSDNNSDEASSAQLAARTLFRAVSSMHWLDAGNGSLRGVFPSNDTSLRSLRDFRELKLVVHVTPYQYCSSDRRWIRKEAHSFVERLKQLQTGAHLIKYYEHESATVPSLHTHFSLLRDFDVHGQSSGKMEAFRQSPVQPLQPVQIQAVKKRNRTDTS